MKYILSNNVALRSWWLVPYAYYIKGECNAYGLKALDYEILKKCDGIQEIDDTSRLQELINVGFCKPALNDEKLSNWQKEKICNNRYFSAMNWMITGRCNYNCLHCFNAQDNNKLQSEFTFEEAEKLIREAEMCGINAITITGGEPMIHPHFMDIIRSIYEHGMYVEELNTNGFFITQEILDKMKEIGCNPLMKISFDGIGHHDWLRNREGAEKDALRAIRLCLENGFKVKVQTNVHRLNLNTMLPTAELLNSIGVKEMRIIRTTEAPRWLQNAKDSCLTFKEYFDEMLLFLKEYAKTDCNMEIEIWQFAHLWPKMKMFRANAIRVSPNGYRDTLPVCSSNRGMVAVGANGNVYPCHQMSGYYEQHNWRLGNVKTDGLQKLLQDSEYLQCVCTTLKDLKENNAKCADCKWFKLCCAGCRAVGLSLTEDVFASDLSKCLFFENGYIKKLEEALLEYRIEYK